jgi:hypothetical protein
MPLLGIACCDITPSTPVWLTGYGNRDRKSEGVYQNLKAGAVYIRGDSDAVLILTADHIGYGSTYAAMAKAEIAQATGLLPRQIVLTATHTHCAPFFSPWIMPGQIEPEYASFLLDRLVEVAVGACSKAVAGHLAWSRGRSAFGVNRRFPDGKGGVRFAPNPDGPIDRDLDTLWFYGEKEGLLGSLSVFGCHPTSLGGYLIGGDYPGFLCQTLEEETGAPALFATGCAGDVRPWYEGEEDGFPRPSLDQLAKAGKDMAAEVLAAAKEPLAADDLRIDGAFHPLAYAPRPDAAALAAAAADTANPRRRDWGRLMQRQNAAGPLPATCPQEIQLLRFNPDFNAVFLGGEILSEIGLHLKEALQPATSITVAYANGLIAYVPSENAYDLGGYEVDGSHMYFLRPAPFAKDTESRILACSRRLAALLDY